jgi:hypothetical protein
VTLDIIQNTLFKSPAEEIELSDGGQECLISGYLETNALATTKGIKQFFAVGLQLVLVIHIHDEFLAIQDIGSAIRLAIIRDEPVDEAKTYLARALKKIHNFVDICASPVETLETGNNEFLLAMNLLLTSLGIWINNGIHDNTLGISFRKSLDPRFAAYYNFVRI